MALHSATISPQRPGPKITHQLHTSKEFDQYVNSLIDKDLEMGHDEAFIANKVSKELYARNRAGVGRNPPRAGVGLGGRRPSHSPAVSKSSLREDTTRGVTHDTVNTILDAQINKWSKVPDSKEIEIPPPRSHHAVSQLSHPQLQVTPGRTQQQFPVPYSSAVTDKPQAQPPPPSINPSSVPASLHSEHPRDGILNTLPQRTGQGVPHRDSFISTGPGLRPDTDPQKVSLHSHEEMLNQLHGHPPSLHSAEAAFAKPLEQPSVHDPNMSLPASLHSQEQSKLPSVPPRNPIPPVGGAGGTPVLMATKPPSSEQPKPAEMPSRTADLPSTRLSSAPESAHQSSATAPPPPPSGLPSSRLKDTSGMPEPPAPPVILSKMPSTIAPDPLISSNENKEPRKEPARPDEIPPPPPAPVIGGSVNIAKPQPQGTSSLRLGALSPAAQGSRPTPPAPVAAATHTTSTPMSASAFAPRLSTKMTAPIATPTHAYASTTPATGYAPPAPMHATATPPVYSGHSTPASGALSPRMPEQQFGRPAYDLTPTPPAAYPAARISPHKERLSPRLGPSDAPHPGQVGVHQPPFPESNISFQVKYASGMHGNEGRPPPSGREPWTVHEHREKPIFPTEAGAIYNFGEREGVSPARQRWKQERLAQLERKRMAHKMNKKGSLQVLVSPEGTLRPVGNHGGQQLMLQQDANGWSVPQPVFSEGGIPTHTPPTQYVNAPSAHPQHPQAQSMQQMPHTMGVPQQPQGSFIQQGMPPSQQGMQPTMHPRAASPRRGGSPVRSPRLRSPHQRPKSVLEMELEYSRPHSTLNEVSPKGVVLERPNDDIPVVPEHQQIFYKEQRFEWAVHPASSVILNLLYLRGIEYGKSDKDTALIEKYMTTPFLNAVSWMMRGTYMVKFGREGDPAERFFFLKETKDSRTGKMVPRLCYAQREDSTSFKTADALTQLVGVQRGTDTPGFRTHKAATHGDEWIKGMRVGNKRRLVSSRGCFTLTFRVQTTPTEEPTYKSFDLMTLKDDVFHAWVPALEALRTIMHDKNLLQPSQTSRPGMFGTGFASRSQHAQKPTQMAVKQPMGPGPVQPTGPMSIKQIPAAPQSGHQGSKCRALLIGVSYERSGLGTLHKAPQFASNVGNFVMRRQGWQGCDVHVLKDSGDVGEGSQHYPTKQNIMNELRWLTSEPDTKQLLYYCGHGREAAKTSDDVMVPVDTQDAGYITEEELTDLVLPSLKPGSSLTCVFDVHGGSGPLLRLPYSVTQLNDGIPSVNLKGPDALTPNRVTVVSGIKGTTPSEHSLGASTSAFTSAASRYPSTVSSLLQGMRSLLSRDSFDHALQVTSSMQVTGGTAFDF